MSERAESSVEILHTSSALVEATKSQGVAEVVAALAVAQRFPRDEAQALARVLRTCQRKSLAEIAQYEFSRGGTSITGPSVHLVRAIATNWGNLKYGWDEVERRPGESTCAAYAWDQQSNTRAERKFIVRHWRDKKGGSGYVLTDERDIYELLANQSARRVRACLQEVIPQDLVELAVAECDKTLTSGQKVPLADRVRQAVASLSEYGISKAQIEDKFQKKAEALTETDLAKLRRIFTALKDGVATPADHFRDETAMSVEPKTKPAKQQPQQPDPDEDNVPYEAAPAAASLQTQLQELCAANGVTFDALKSRIAELGWTKTVPSFDSAPSFAEVSDADCDRLLKAKRGLLMHLKGGGK